jgi:hypothetical protein
MRMPNHLRVINSRWWRLLAHALRWLAHSNTAHLVYLGGLHPAGPTAAGESIENQVFMCAQ